jgi:dTMP kinase
MSRQQGDGRYIVIEGPHRSGKTTHQELTVRALHQRGYSVCQAAEPTHGGWARAYVQQNTSVDARTAALLMYADRRRLLQELVQPALALGEWVVQSRNYLSTYVLQGAYGGLSYSALDRLHTFSLHELVRPDLIIVLDPGESVVLQERVEVHQLDEDALERGISQPDQERLIGAYRELAAMHSDWPIRFVDTNQPVAETHRQIMLAIDRLDRRR